MTVKISKSLAPILTFFCLLIAGIATSQNQKTTAKTVFGKTITAKSINPNNGIIRCATVEYEQYLQEKNPQRMTIDQFETWLAPLAKKQTFSQKNAKTAAVIKIPVVVHVIHSGQAIGTAPNITDAQVQSQITVLNQDFRKLLGSPGYNTNTVGADVEIEFVLAKQDPNGNPTNGINRVNMCQAAWSETEINETVKPATIWDPAQYMNMWSVKFSNNKLAGFAQFPNSSGLAGIPSYNGEAVTDGVVSSFDVFGSSDLGVGFLLAAPYDKGRTMTHEVGHYLGLRHIWGDGSGDEDTNKPDCAATDYCADTPQAGWENYNCPKPPAIPYDSCPVEPGNDMVENYMDYTDDACMNIFTLDQKTRILAVMNNSPLRVSLGLSDKGAAIPLFALDAEVKIAVDYCSESISECSALPAPTNKKVTLTNRGTTTLTSVNLQYSMSGGANQNQIWAGSLAQNQSAEVTLNNTATSGVLTVNAETVNGTIDQRTTNNSSSQTFSPVNYNYTNYIFSLQQDFWGAEVTWNLKNGAGAIVYEGGPYNDKPSQVLPLPAIITQNWILATNQCYTFTINDSQGDGICCEGGNGFYNIKSSDGLATVKTGASYGAKDIAFFTTNTLGTTAFENSSEIYVYPNPTTATLTIHIPADFGLPKSYFISTVLGQIISRKEVATISDLTINTAALSQGAYFVTINKEGQTKTLQFIKE